MPNAEYAAEDDDEDGQQRELRVGRPVRQPAARGRPRAT